MKLRLGEKIEIGCTLILGLIGTIGMMLFVADAVMS